MLHSVLFGKVRELVGEIKYAFASSWDISQLIIIDHILVINQHAMYAYMMDTELGEFGQIKWEFITHRCSPCYMIHLTSG